MGQALSSLRRRSGGGGRSSGEEDVTCLQWLSHLSSKRSLFLAFKAFVSCSLIFEGSLGGSGLARTLRALPGSTGTAPQACGQCTGKARVVLGLLAGCRFDSRLYDLCVGFQLGLGAVDGNPELLLARRGERVAVYNVQRPEMRGLQLARGYVSRLHGACCLQARSLQVSKSPLWWGWQGRVFAALAQSLIFAVHLLRVALPRVSRDTWTAMGLGRVISLVLFIVVAAQQERSLSQSDASPAHAGGKNILKPSSDTDYE